MLAKTESSAMGEVSLEVVVTKPQCKDPESSSPTSSSLRLNIPVRQKLLCVFGSSYYQLVVLVLVSLEALVVVLEILFNLEGPDEAVYADTLHAVSLAFLSLFTLEILVKVFVYRMEYFTMKGEMFDAGIVIVSLTLDAYTFHQHDAMVGTGFLILLRFWRLVRVQNSIVLGVQKSQEHKLQLANTNLLKIEKEMLECRTNITKLKECYLSCIMLLKDNKLVIPPSCLMNVENLT